MSTVRRQNGSYTIQASNAIESIALDKPKATFRKLFIYPGQPNVVTGLVTANSDTIYIGDDADGPKITPDALAPGDPPLVFELPANINEQMLLKDMLIQGTAGDGVFFKYWQ